MQVVIVIPARYASSRLPGKPLLRETGRYLIEHVHELATKAKHAQQVIIATDDERIADAVRSFGGVVEITSPDHQSGTDRIAEVASRIPAEIVINLQGDEPQFAPADIDRLALLMLNNPEADMATLATPIRTRADYLNPNIVKVVCDRDGRALYFSRSPLPAVRDGEPDFDLVPSLFLQHLGVYAYRRETLLRLAVLPMVSLEQTEKLEQLRALHAGIAIHVGVIPIAHKGVDTPADYEAFVRAYGAEFGREV